MSQYQVVEFAGGGFGVTDIHTGGFYGPPSFIDRMLGLTSGNWWYSYPFVSMYSVMGQAKAARVCKKLQKRTDYERSQREAVRVVKTYSCE